MVNRKEGMNQESIQVPNTFRARHQREKGRIYSNDTTIKTLQAESQKDSLFPPKKWQNGYPK